MNNDFRLLFIFYYSTDLSDFILICFVSRTNLWICLFIWENIIGGKVMIYNRIKDVREDKDFTQDYIAERLKVKRSTYANWENSDVLIPLEKLDNISIIFNVPFSYLLGINKKYDKSIKVKPINYELLLNRLNKYRKDKKQTYQLIADAIETSKGTIYKYYNGQMKIPVDKLVLLSKFYNCDIDELTGKL